MLSSKNINIANHNFVSQMIQNKKNPFPYYSSGPSTVTDMDVFPYTRFYRGQPTSNEVFVMDREAGWKPVHNSCYNTPVVRPPTQFYPNHCFQAAPSVSYPCYPETLRKYSDKEALQMQLLRKRINEYR